MNTPTNKTLSELYAEFKEHLDNPSTAFQDAALNTAVKIEAAVREILSHESHPIDSRRIRRYGLDTEKPNPLHITSAQEAQVLKDTIGIGLSTHHLLNQIIRRQNHIAQILEPKSYAEICEQLDIVMSMHPDGKERPFVPTTHKNTAPQTGSGTGFETKKDRIPKFLECIRLLPEIATPDGGHIDTRDILVDMQDTTPDNMLRTLPYAIIRIPRLNRTILVNDEHGQATFVLQGLIDISLIQTTNKDDLVTTLWAQRIIYHPIHWKTRLERYLLNDWEHTTEKGTDTDIQNAHTAPSSTAYLSDNPDDTTDTYTLTKKNEPKARIKNLDLYPFVLDWALIRETLLQFAEHISTDKRKQSKELGEWEELQSSEEKEKYDIQRLHALSTNNPSYNTRITLKNGESMTWETYLNNASSALFGTRHGKTDNPHRKSDALNRLKEIIELIPLNVDYFTNKEYISRDLILFARAWNISVHDLSTSNPSRDTQITLTNGGGMTWQTYLNTASAVFFGTKPRTDNPHRYSDALNRLKETIGLILLDEKYFTNKEYITKDLETFAQAWNISVHNLSTTNPSRDTQIALANGGSMTWKAYLNTASAALFGTKQHTDNPHRQSDALNSLKQTIGLISLDENYFTNKEYISHDLTWFAQAWNISVHDLSTSNPSRDTRLTLTNGESMTWQTYLRKARKMLEPGAICTWAQALGILKERGGFTTSVSVPQEKKDIKTPKE